mmetsp:Transcript_17762/g.41459  ORF Transcript_17762/g.41459 Transcript_17762/m.41459 type:complete len:176 (+) Transcript_17762:528-1055(+)
MPCPKAVTWESRNDQHCEVFWPGRRSGHAAVYDVSRHGIWIHGGYNSYFPYPTSKDEGSGPGTQSLGMQHKAFLPAYQFWLDDLWFYDIESGYWRRENIFGRQPARRSGHILIASGDIFLLHILTGASGTTPTTMTHGIISWKNAVGCPRTGLSMPTSLLIVRTTWTLSSLIPPA